MNVFSNLCPCICRGFFNANKNKYSTTIAIVVVVCLLCITMKVEYKQAIKIMTRVQEIAKKLNKAGFKKAGYARVDFQNVPTGHYTARYLKIYGLNCITILPTNGTTCEELLAVLVGEKAFIKKGYVVIE